MDFRHLRHLLLGLVLALASGSLFAESPVGADSVTDLYSPAFIGGGAFTTSSGGSSASAYNPAANALEQRVVLDAGYAALPGISGESGLGHAANLGLVYPTKAAVLAASIHFLTSPFDAMPVGTEISGDFSASKELYKNFSVGAGLYMAAGTDAGAAVDLGVSHEIGNLWKLKGFEWALVLSGIGISPAPTAFTPMGGVSFDVVQASAFTLGVSADLGVPGFQNLTGKVGIDAHVGSFLSVSSSTGFNLKEAGDGNAASYIPSIGVSLHFPIAGKKKIAGIPTDGEAKITTAARPLYDGVWAIGTGLELTLGVKDTQGPKVTVDYPATRFISPNNDGKADALELPISITDERYILEWNLEIRNASGELVRTLRNKERRAENTGWKDVWARLTDVQSGVEVPDSLRWDGNLDSGAIAPDGRYTFTLKAKDDNANEGSSPILEVVVDNTPPDVAVPSPADPLRILSPDGDGNKDSFPIAQSGSTEENWKAGIVDAAGTTVRSFDLAAASPQAFAWDGKDNSGRVVPDGVYRYEISATDRAQNSGKASLDNIIVNTEKPVVSLLLKDSAFSPNQDGINDVISLAPGITVRQGIEKWTLEIQDLSDAPRRTISGASSVPASLDFDGKDNAGAPLAEAQYKAKLSVVYQNGTVSTAISPAFTLDVTKPSATIAAVDGTAKDALAFSPNGDGKQDAAKIDQKASAETVWLGEVTSITDGITVKAFRFDGKAPAALSWDGRDESGKLSPDGQYAYKLTATDAAGNRGESNKVSITLSTADTPVFLSTSLAAFSPNADKVRDSIVLTPQLKEKTGIADWKIEILDGGKNTVRTFSGSASAPAPAEWNGRNDKGDLLKDGIYIASLHVRYEMGNEPTVQSAPFALDTVAPALELSAPYKLFSPNEDGRKDTLPLSLSTAGNDEWDALVSDSRGNTLYNWHWQGAAPTVTWDGKDKAGNTVVDGTYRLTVRSTDAAGNKTEKGIDGIGVDSRAVRIFLTASGAGLSPNQDKVADDLKFACIVNLKDGIESWKLTIRDDTGNPVKTFASATAGSLPPAQLVWDGLNEEGKLVEGKRTAELSVQYQKGDLAVATAGPFTVDVTAPALAMATSPEWFSPDNDGLDDDLSIKIAAPDASPIESWSLEIHEPASSGGQLFFKTGGKSAPTDKIIWDGRSNKGELVQAATDYDAIFTAVDVLGNRAELKSVIGVDVLVIREGDLLKIKVPSIVFRPSYADFKDLPPDQIKNNEKVLKRIALILNKFKDYKIKVEGHANPVTRTAQEEKNDLQPLSEARAKAIVSELVRLDVDRGRLSSIGMGGTRPVVPWESKADWWKNRRVEFILIK